MPPQGERIIEFLLQVLDEEESDKVQALICVGMSKLMLSGMIADDRVCCYLDLLPDLADTKFIGPTKPHSRLHLS